MKYYIFSCQVVLFTFFCSFASVINVPADIDSIQGGINLANHNDTVLVQPGIYIENIDFIGKSIVVGSLFLTTGDASYIEQTIIDRNQNGSAAKFENEEDTLSILCGFTLQNGSGTYFGGIDQFYLGGGIFCEYYPSASPTLKNLIIKNNYATEGGGIYCGGDAKLINLIIKNNWVYSRFYGGGEGGGIYCVESNPILKRVIIYNNYAPSWGAGISCYDSNPLLINVTVSLNYIGASSDWHSGGIHCIVSSPILVNSILWNNFPNEIEIHPYGSASIITIAYTDLKDGQQGIVTNNNGIINWLDGNIDTNPFFADTSGFDFRLLVGSPCIDAGIQDTFIVYNNDLDTLFVAPMSYMGSAPDMGAYEFDPSLNIKKVSESQNQFSFYQNYPNPFNSTTTIRYTLPKAAIVKIELFNMLGQRIETLLNKHMPIGSHEVEFIAKDLPSGVYLFRIKVGEFQEDKKMLFLK